MIALIDTSKFYITDGKEETEDTLNTGYMGHYILIIDCDGDGINFLDPSTGPEIKKISWEFFEKLRKAYGTDEDLIFIDITQ